MKSYENFFVYGIRKGREHLMKFDIDVFVFSFSFPTQVYGCNGIFKDAAVIWKRGNITVLKEVFVTYFHSLLYILLVCYLENKTEQTPQLWS